MTTQISNKKIMKIQTIIFRGIFLMITVLFTVVVLLIGLFLYQKVITTTGDFRADMLKQISVNGTTVNKAATFVCKNIYENQVYYLLTNNDPSNEDIAASIEAQFMKDELAFQALDIELSLMVIMKDGFEFRSDSVIGEEVETIKNSFWYIDNFSNDKNNLWVTRFGRFNNRANMEISYVKVIRDAAREYQGIIIVSALERTVYDVYSDVHNDGNQIYIVDETGTIISHANKNLIGIHKYYMKAFFEEYPKNSFIVRDILDEKVLFSNYNDPDTGWTIIEEYTLSNIWQSYKNLVYLGIGAFILLLLFGLVVSNYVSRLISRPIVRFTKNLASLDDTALVLSEIQYQYEEIYSMSIIFNDLGKRLKDSMNQYKEEERLKRKIEFDFLQAQINPHLLHNTLFSIKCLLDLNKRERAVSMLESFMRLLKAPINIDKTFVAIEDEVLYLEDYIRLMENRYENDIQLNVSIEDSLRGYQMPRMLLQPIVENSIFHGFGDQQKGCIIDLVAEKIDEDVLVTIEDNGVGLTTEQLNGIWSEDQSGQSKFNRIGLKNIRERMRLVYGQASDLFLESEIGNGTKVILFMSKKGLNDEENYDCG